MINFRTSMLNRFFKKASFFFLMWELPILSNNFELCFVDLLGGTKVFDRTKGTEYQINEKTRD